MPPPTTPYGGGTLQGTGSNINTSFDGQAVSTGYNVSPWANNPGQEVLPFYGGYGGGFGSTMSMEQQLAQQAQHGKAAHANFGQANNYFNLENQYGKQQGQTAKSLNPSIGQYGQLMRGQGISAADYGVPGQVSQ